MTIAMDMTTIFSMIKTRRGTNGGNLHDGNLMMEIARTGSHDGNFMMEIARTGSGQLGGVKTTNGGQFEYEMGWNC